jgi:hypothetical protein
MWLGDGDTPTLGILRLVAVLCPFANSHLQEPEDRRWAIAPLPGGPQIRRTGGSF